MTSSVAVAPVAAPGTRPPTGPRKTLQVLRVVTVLHTLSMLAQPVLAGVYLGGDVDGIAMHRFNAMVVTGLDVIQLVCAIVFTWKGRGRFWPVWASLAVALAVEVQVGVGFERIMAVHVPLGVSIIVTQVLVTVWLFRPSAGTARMRRRPRSERG